MIDGFIKNGLAFFLFSSFAVHAFSSLEQAVAYAKRYPATQAISDYPVHSIRYPHWKKTKSFKNFFGLFKENNSWSPNEILPILSTITKAQEQHANKQQYALVFKVTPGARFFIFSNLQGAFHTLVDALINLKQQGIINDQLSIIKPNCFLVFNGNNAAGSLFVLETLSIILTLMHNNPGKVIYLKGYSESNNNWRDGYLRPQIRLHEYLTQEQRKELEFLLVRFFSQLPIALYVTDSANKEALAISYSTCDYLTCDLKTADEPAYCVFNKTAKSDITVQACIKGQHAFAATGRHQGLALGEPDNGATTWTVVSASTDIYKKQFGFIHDAFVLLTVAVPLYNSTVSLYARDTSVQSASSAFMLKATYNIITGQESKVNTQELKKYITIGSTMDLSETVRGIGLPIKSGISLKINQQNNLGGIKGSYIKLVILDDKYNPTLAQQNITTLVKKYNTRTLLSPVGTPTLESSLDIIKQQHIAVLFPRSGASVLRQSGQNFIINFRASFASEGFLLTRYIITKYQPKNIVFFYQDSTLGKELLSGARKALIKSDIKTSEIAYTSQNTVFKEIADTIRQANPDVIALFSTGHALLGLIKDLPTEFLTNKIFYAASSAADEITLNVLAEKEIPIIWGSVVPDPVRDERPLVRHYRQDAQKQGLKPNVFSLESYIAASITCDVLNKISSAITTSGILKKLESFNNYNFEGFNLTFDPTNRSIAQYYWIVTPDGQFIEQNLKDTAYGS